MFIRDDSTFFFLRSSVVTFTGGTVFTYIIPTSRECHSSLFHGEKKKNLDLPLYFTH